MEQGVAAIDSAGLNQWQDVLNVVGGQVAQEIAFRKQRDQVLDLVLFASALVVYLRSRAYRG